MPVPLLGRIFVALSAASRDLLLFIGCFFVVLIGFAAAFCFAFSADVFEFRSVGVSLVSLLRFLIGDVRFEPLLRVNKQVATFLRMRE